MARLLSLPGERKEITLDPKTLNRYVGAYRMAPGAQHAHHSR